MSTAVPDPLRQRFLQAAAEYDMVSPGDRVIVAVSGGKDSFTLLDLFGRLQEEAFPRAEFTVTQIKTDIT